jgi:hypothetical protein
MNSAAAAATTNVSLSFTLYSALFYGNYSGSRAKLLPVPPTLTGKSATADLPAAVANHHRAK